MFLAPRTIVMMLVLVTTLQITRGDSGPEGKTLEANPARNFPANVGPSSVSPIALAKGEPDTVSHDAMLLLKKQCFGCHNAEKKKGGLIMTSREALAKGSDNGPVIIPGKAGESRLAAVLVPDADPHMPPRKQLSGVQIALLRNWIDGGARWDDQALAEAATSLDPGQIHPLPATYHPVLALALSPDGKRLAAGRGHTIWIYSISQTNRAAEAQCEGHRDAVQSLAWSPDGRWLASGGFRKIVLWDAAKWVTSIEFTNLSGRITALAFTPDSTTLAAADGVETQSGLIRLWKVPAGEPRAAWSAHHDAILDLKASPDGKSLASAGVDKLVRIWELPDGKAITQFEGHNGHVLALGFKPDGSFLASGSADSTIKIWDLKTKEQKITITGQRGGVTALAWSSDGKNVFSACDDGAVRVSDDSKDHPDRTVSSTGDFLHAVAVSPDGKQVYAGGEDGFVYLWQGNGVLLQKLGVSEQPKESRGVELPQVAQGARSSATVANAGSPFEATGDQAVSGPSPGQLAPTERRLSFINDVLPVLGKAGCNAGKCHAKPEGQNGFMLSVFAYDPKHDFQAIVKAARGRRVFPGYPEESLLLRKPTLAIPHEGGERFERGSKPYQTLVRWIEQGMPYASPNDPRLLSIRVSPSERRYRKGEKNPLRVQAHFSDGSIRDVTELTDFTSNDKEIASVEENGLVTVGRLSGEAVIIARYMGLVEISRITVPAERSLPDSLYASLPVNNFIDALAYARFKQLGLFPSDTCSDAEFIRRASLDAIGALPTPEETRQFLEDRAADKRSQLVDRLLNHPAYADHWAAKWGDLIRPNPDRVGVKSVFTLDQWLRESFRQNEPYDRFVREILTAQGSTHRYGPTVVFRDRREPQDLTTLVSQIFLGVRLECARCHHHPNEKWSQDDFYQFAAYFSEIKRKGTGISPPISGDFEVIYHAPGGEVKHPVTDAVMRPKPPDGPLANAEEGGDPRRALADWVCRPDNPFFARAIVNRVWAEFMGRGFVDPVDDFRTSNPPSNEPLLEALAKDFILHHYDLKHLMRTIQRSHLYQLSALPNEYNVSDVRHFSRSYRRRLPAEVLADAVADVTGVPTSFQGLPAGSHAKETWNYKIHSEFMDAFGRPNSSSDCPCERDTKPSVVQALHLMNSADLQAKISHPEGRAKRLASSDRSTKEIVVELYLAAYSRYPSPEELSLASRAFAADGATRQSATEDVLWALLNSAEFVFNH